MIEADEEYLSEVEALLKERFKGGVKPRTKFPSDAREPASPARTDQLLLAEEERGGMPFTKDKYLVKENPELVAWEREVRKFLRKLSPSHGHRVSAVMIYEWATGIDVAELMAQGGSTADLKRINKILRFYFDKPYMTYICGRKVPKAYRVKQGTYITRRRPMTLTLYAEYCEGTLYP